MASYDTFEIVETLQSIANRDDIILNKYKKPTIIECLENWGFIETGSEPYPCMLTENGYKILEGQKVKQFRRKHFFDFLSRLNSKIEERGNSISYDMESKDGSLVLSTRIPYNRTVAERKILDEIAKDMRMRIETKGDAREYSREYIFKNERAQIDLHSVKSDYIHNRRTITKCDPLFITVYPSKPISPVEKLITLLVERLGR